MAKSTKPASAGPKPAPAGRNRLYLILGAVALVLIGAVLYSQRGGGAQGATEPVTLSFTDAELQQAQGNAMGQDNAPVVIMEFADFQCPACAQYVTFTHPLIKERLVDQGIVRLVRYDFPLVQAHPNGFLASRAARCAGEQERYWEYHDVLYGRQPTWSAMGNPTAQFEEYAELTGLDGGAFAECLRSDRHAEEVTRNLRLGESLGVNATPTLMIDGERILARDFQELEARVYEAAGLPAPAAAPGAG